MANKETLTKGFYRMSCMDCFGPDTLSPGVTENIQIENRSSIGGAEYEFGFNWRKIGTPNPAARLEIFDDAFKALTDNEALFKMLPHLKDPTPDDIHKLLLDLGYEDFSDKKLYPKTNAGIDTYICYVQNYLGIMDGEDVVSNMAVFSNQEDIDNWFTEQIAEAKETGFEPEDDPATYLGISDYELRMSKGNDEEGYTNYGIVCKPYRMNL